MWSARNYWGDDRAVSEILGVVLLIGVVLASAVLIAVVGSSAISGVEEQNEIESAMAVMEEMDGRFSAFTGASQNRTIDLGLGNVDPDTMSVARSGSITVTANHDANCEATVDLSSVRYEGRSGQTIAFEAGGIWRAGDQGGSVVVSSPDVTFQNGTLSVGVYDLRGELQDSSPQARSNVTATRADTRQVRDDLYGPGCLRPTNLTMMVESDFDVAWAQYLRAEAGDSVTRFQSNDTVRLRLESEDLPTRANDTRNDVVNLSQSPEAAYMEYVKIENDRITVNKSVKNNYTVRAAPLYSRLDVGEVRNVETAQNVRRRPMDLIFVTDESGSMGDGSPTKMSQAQSAAKGFLSDLDSTVDRAAVVGYTMVGADDKTEVLLTSDGEYLSNDFSSTGINGSIDDLVPDDYTNMNGGIKRVNELYDYFSDQNRDRIAILLSDGRNNHVYGQPETDQLNASTIDQAHAAEANDVTIYTVGFSSDESDVADGLLRDVADITGGEYYFAADGDELQDRFEQILDTVNTSPRVIKKPMTTQFTASREYPPTIPGDTTHLARDDSTGTTYLNVNDPTAPAMFGHTFRIAGNESVDIGATEYDCETWEGTTETVDDGGKTYQVARCADLDESSASSVPTTVYGDGDDVSSLLSSSTSDWQADMNDRLDPYLDGTNLDLRSNQVVIAYDFEDSADSDNIMLVFYEIGLSENDTRANVFEPRVYNLTLSD